MDKNQIGDKFTPTFGEAGISDALQRLTDWVLHRQQRWVILIDGRSGAGKTTFAMDLWRNLTGEGGVYQARFNRHPTLVHLDDFYPGWGGLDEARSMVARCVLDAEKPGFRRWDWCHDQPGAWVALDPGKPLIIEGVGSLNAEALATLKKQRLAHCSVVVDAPATIRELRALNRDPGFAPWWKMWAEQEETHLKTRPVADLQVDSTCP